MPNPVPQNLAKQANKAASVIESFTQQSATKGPDKFLIPRDVIDRCQGLAVISVVRAGVFCAIKGGSGVVFAKKHSGEWSAPAAISMVGISGGFAFGVELTNFVLVLNTEDAVLAFARGNVTLGANVSVAAGPVGRSAEADVAIKNTAAVFTYSKSSGLFAGVSLEGAGIIVNDATNKKFYGREIKAVEVLTHDGVADMKHYGEFARLYKALQDRSAYNTSTSSLAPSAPSQRAKSVKSPASRSTSKPSLRKAPSPPPAKAKPPPPSRSPPSEPASRSYSSGSGLGSRYPNTNTTSSSSYGSKPTYPTSTYAAPRSTYTPPASASSYRSSYTPAPSYTPSYTPSAPSYTPSAPSYSPSDYDQPGASSSYGTYGTDTASAPEPCVPARPEWGDVAVDRGRALFDYACSQPGDLDLRTGDEVCVLVKDSSGWWQGRNMHTGCYGVFPAAYVSCS